MLRRKMLLNDDDFKLGNIVSYIFFPSDRLVTDNFGRYQMVKMFARIHTQFQCGFLPAELLNCKSELKRDLKFR